MLLADEMGLGKTAQATYQHLSTLEGGPSDSYQFNGLYNTCIYIYR